MKTKYLFLFLLLLSATLVRAQSLNMRFNTQIYSWQRADSIGSDSKTSHLRGYQNLLLDFGQKNWGFNTLVSAEEDFMNKSGKGFYYRFYNLYFWGSNLFKVLDVKLGRQYLFSGVGNGSMDGLNLRLKAGKKKELQFTAYGGALTAQDYEIKEYPSLDNNFVLGGAISYYGLQDFNATLSYVNQHKKPQPYSALRLDSMMSTNVVLIDLDARTNQLIGLDLNYSYQKKYNFFAKAYYDINSLLFYKGEFNASVPVSNEVRLNGFYYYRQPQISYNSIFQTFASSENQEVGGSIDYTFKNGYTIFGSVSDVIYTDDNSLKFQLGLNSPIYGLSYTRYSGYAGESDGATAYYYREIVKSKLSCNIGLNFSRYNVGNYSNDKENAFSGSLGLTFRPMPQFSVDAQGQLITNTIYKYDSRFLLGINYWFFKKL